jgi:O-antigen ligase
MGFVAILQKLSGTDKILWVVEVLNKNPWGTFAYRNQGAAYLLLVLLISGGLYFFYERQSYSKLKQSGPHMLIFLFILILGGSIWLSLSRSGIILGASLLGLFLILVLLRTFLRGINSKLWTIIGTFLGLLLFGGFFIFKLSDWNEVNKRKQSFEQILLNIESYERVLSTKATWEMAQDRLIFGWGAGSYRYTFPIYQKKYELLWYHHDSKDRPYGRKIYNYAHNDWVQFLAEYGIFGCVFIALMFFCLIVPFLLSVKNSILISGFLLLGLMLIFANNFTDFIFSCPAYWVAFWASLLLVYQLFKLESKIHYIA